VYFRYGTSTFNTFKKLGIPYRPVYIPFLGHYYDLLTKVYISTTKFQFLVHIVIEIRLFIEFLSFLPSKMSEYLLTLLSETCYVNRHGQT